MKKKFLISLGAMLFLMACNNTGTMENDTTSDTAMQDPSNVQPPQEAIPDSMHLSNDSVIVPDRNTQINNQPSPSDTLR